LERPESEKFTALFPIIFLFSYLTWRFVEAPFRNRSFIGKRNVFIFSALFSAVFVVIGLFLNKSYGIPSRVFDADILISDMDKRLYNERIFSYKKDVFGKTSPTKILIIGNSFARDFTNITIENFDVSRVDIIYRDDLSECIEHSLSEDTGNLFSEADVIVFASGGYDKNCYIKDISFASRNNKKIYYIGTKEFGYNLNWLVGLTNNERRSQFNFISDETINADKEMSKVIPREHFISLIASVLSSGKVPITDEFGRMLSTDRAHLTKYGALYFGKNAVLGTSYSELFKRSCPEN